MRIALVHDYLSQDGGAERVLLAMHDIWPEAPIFVLFHDKKKITQFVGADVRESSLARFPGVRSRYQWYLPLMPLATERYNLHDFDVVLSSTSAFAKGVLTRPETLHISYCHTPTRYLWTDTHEYLADLRYGPLVKTFLLPLIHRLRMWDRMSVDRVDHFLANSQTVARRIWKYYRRESDVIYPPVDVDQFSPSGEIGNYFLTGGRLVPYKRFDIVVEVFNRLRWPLKIFGTGPEGDSLRRRAHSNIEFVGRISDKEKAEFLRHSRAFIHPQVEDLGITPIESMASGRPVIAFGIGGATETIVEGATGVFFRNQSWESLLDAIIHFEKGVWNASVIRAHAEQFHRQIFQKSLKQFVENKYEHFLSRL